MAARGRTRVRRVGSVIDRVLAGLGVDEVVDRHRVLVDWKGRVGEEVARATHPQRLDGDVLIVGVCSPAWLNELSLRRTEILRALNAGQRRGKIRKIVYRLDPELDG